MSTIIKLSFILIFTLLYLVCTDANVIAISNNIYAVKDANTNSTFYLKRVIINGDKIYFIVNEQGNLIAGASTSYLLGKTPVHVTSVLP